MALPLSSAPLTMKIVQEATGQTPMSPSLGVPGIIRQEPLIHTLILQVG